MQASATTQTLDTSIPMDIDQNQPRPAICICYNCGDKGHLAHTCLKPQKQRIWLTKATKVDLKSIIAEAVTAAMDVRDMAKKTEQAKSQRKLRRIFRQFNGEAHFPFYQ